MIQGVFCLTLGLVTLNYDAPTFEKGVATITGFVDLGAGSYSE
jgi:hypothetical protein